jgi:hypothetical protein
MSISLVLLVVAACIVYVCTLITDTWSFCREQQPNLKNGTCGSTGNRKLMSQASLKCALFNGASPTGLGVVRFRKARAGDPNGVWMRHGRMKAAQEGCRPHPKANWAGARGLSSPSRGPFAWTERQEARTMLASGGRTCLLKRRVPLRVLLGIFLLVRVPSARGAPHELSRLVYGTGPTD